MAATFSTLAAAAPSAVITTTSTVVATTTGTACTTSTTTAATTTLFRVGDAVIDVTKWHMKIGQERDDQHGKDGCHQVLSDFLHGLILLNG
jgi:hypothetical protein